jgi:hypothetical protein
MDSYEFIQQLIMQKQQTLHKLKPLQSLSDILIMSYQLMIQTLQSGFHWYTSNNLRQKIVLSVLWFTDSDNPFNIFIKVCKFIMGK